MGNINSISLPVYKFLIADKKKPHKNPPLFLISSGGDVMLKRCTYEEGCTVWMSSLCSFLLPVLSAEDSLKRPRGTLQFTTPQWGTAGADVAAVWSTRLQDLHWLHEQGDISPPHHSVAQQEPVQYKDE